MEFASLEYRTDVMFWNVAGAVRDRGSYLVVDTPTRRGWYYGNLLVFPAPPGPFDAEHWIELFHREFGGDPRVRHVAVAWEGDRRDPATTGELRKRGFEIEVSITLSASEVRPPARPNSAVAIREIVSESDWQQVIAGMIATRESRFAEESYSGFIRSKVAAYRRLIAQGLGAWHGAFIGERLAGDLGLFFQQRLGRFQSVSTAPEFRRQGICGTLVTEVARRALADRADRLVMVADEEYVAARIYESVGFEPVERNACAMLYPPEERSATSA